MSDTISNVSYQKAKKLLFDAENKRNVSAYITSKHTIEVNVVFYLSDGKPVIALETDTMNFDPYEIETFETALEDLDISPDTSQWNVEYIDG